MSVDVLQRCHKTIRTCLQDLVLRIRFARMAPIHKIVEKLQSTKKLHFVQRIHLYRIECPQHRPDHGLSTQDKQARVVHCNFNEQPAMRGVFQETSFFCLKKSLHS